MKTSRGFTLIEFLVVIAIIALLLGINAWVYGRSSDYNGFSADYAWKHTFAKMPNNIPIFGDCMWRGGFPEDDDPPQETEETRFIDDKKSMGYFNMNRHSGATNLVFMDLSMRKVPLKGLWRLRWHKQFDTQRPFPDWPDWMANMSE